MLFVKVAAALDLLLNSHLIGGRIGELRLQHILLQSSEYSCTCIPDVGLELRVESPVDHEVGQDHNDLIYDVPHAMRGTVLSN